jgi:hypothetical protein
VRLSINLRGDLAKLSDEELAARLTSAWERHQAAEHTAAGTKIWYSRRGPIRHPWAYYFLSVLGVSGRGGMSLGLGPFIRRGYMGMHLALCEIRDIEDEIQRRVERKRALAT